MLVNFIAQPERQLGTLLTTAISAPKIPTKLTIVSAFASLTAILRLKQRLHELRVTGALVRIVVGVDMGGTGKEVLQELATWDVEVFIFKNKKGSVTFHPKLYIVETAGSAEIFLGSNNLTDGGLYGNYEGAVQVTYNLPEDKAELDKAKAQLSKFIEPGPPVGKILDAEYLAVLLARKDIPDAKETRKKFKAAKAEEGEYTLAVANAFGYEPTQGPPNLPIELQQVVMAAVRHQLDYLQVTKKKARKDFVASLKSAQAAAAATGTQVVLPTETEPVPTVITPIAQITPNAFYLELTATQGVSGNIPGEQRIPLEALNAAQDFFGWPDNYTKSINPRKGLSAPGIRRVYYEWKPSWRVYSTSDATKDVTVNVRMYFVQANSDYRFHVGNLVKWANAGDIVRITRHENGPHEYECALALSGTPTHAQWKAICALGSTHSPRVFGFS